jgi:hypothetical protein
MLPTQPMQLIQEMLPMELILPLHPELEINQAVQQVYQGPPTILLKTTYYLLVATTLMLILFSAMQDLDQYHSTLLNSLISSQCKLTLLALKLTQFNQVAKLVLLRLTNASE